MQPMIITKHTEYDDCGLRRAYELCNGEFHGAVTDYGDDGRLTRKATYNEGKLDGDMTIYAPVCHALGQIDSALQADLDQSAVSPETIAALALLGIVISAIAEVVVEEIGHEWTVTQFDRGYTLLAEDGVLAVYLGRVVRRATFKDNKIVHKRSYAYGRPEGEVATYNPSPDSKALFELPLSFVEVLNEGNIAELQPIFELKKQPLTAEAVVVIEVPEREWTIVDGAQVYTVLLEKGALAVYLAALFELPLSFAEVLNEGNIAELQPIFELKKQPLTAEAVVVIEVPEREWTIVDGTQVYTVLLEKGALLLFRGRLLTRSFFVAGAIVQKSAFQGGRLEGMTISYDLLRPSLFDTDTSLSELLNGGALNALQPLFADHGHPLHDDAVVSTEVVDNEWLISQKGQSYTVKGVEDRLQVSAGRVIQKAPYVAGQLKGVLTLYDVGVMVQTVEFKAGELDGVTTSFAPDGHRVNEVKFHEGLKQGAMVTYDVAGEKTAVATYEQDQMDGPMVLYQKGQLAVQASYKAGQQDGVTTTYDETGQIQLISTYKGGLLNGYSYMFYPSGQISQISIYRAGKREGLYRTWDEIGKYTEVSWYEAGDLSGPRCKFYPAEPDKGPLVKEISFYKDGKLDGPYYAYDKNGTVKKFSYKEGVYDPNTTPPDPTNPIDSHVALFAKPEAIKGQLNLIANYWKVTFDGKAKMKTALFSVDADPATFKHQRHCGCSFYPADLSESPKIKAIVAYKWDKGDKKYKKHGAERAYTKGKGEPDTTVYYKDGKKLADGDPDIGALPVYLNKNMEVHDDGTVRLL